LSFPFLSIPVLVRPFWRTLFDSRQDEEFLVEKDKNIFPRKEGQKKRLILAGFCLSVIAAAALVGRERFEDDKDKIQNYNFQPTTVRTIAAPEEPYKERLLVESALPSVTPNSLETPTSTSTPTLQPIEEEILKPIGTPIPIGTGSAEVQADPSTKPKDGQTVQGWATYYGVTDGYGFGDTLGCTGESFDPYEPTTAARPYSSPFVCGDRVEVCDSDSCIEVVIKDTCPGCDDFGIVIDLSYGAMQKLSPGSGRVQVTIKKLE
jgi:rare lipoprotein A (peptidoglycan hydrolase)